jgi:hypothetical protein
MEKCSLWEEERINHLIESTLAIDKDGNDKQAVLG